VSNQATAIRITLNGQILERPVGEKLLTLVQSLGLKPDRLAIELDRRIIKPAEWSSTEISEGAAIEIVHFVGGG